MNKSWEIPKLDYIEDKYKVVKIINNHRFR